MQCVREPDRTTTGKDVPIDIPGIADDRPYLKKIRRNGTAGLPDFPVVKTRATGHIGQVEKRYRQIFFGSWEIKKHNAKFYLFFCIMILLNTR
jgi:hypothetical protein